MAEISQDGRDASGVKGDNIDRLLLERNLDLINQVRDTRCFYWSLALVCARLGFEELNRCGTGGTSTSVSSHV